MENFTNRSTINTVCVNNFEKKSRISLLYGTKPICHTNKKPPTAEDILSMVTGEVQKIQKADIFNDRKRGNYLDCVKKSVAFLSVSSLNTHIQKEQLKLNLQEISDTEMLDAVDGAEAMLEMVDSNGITQLMEKSLSNKQKFTNLNISADYCPVNEKHVIPACNKEGNNQNVLKEFRNSKQNSSKENCKMLMQQETMLLDGKINCERYHDDLNKRNKIICFDETTKENTTINDLGKFIKYNSSQKPNDKSSVFKIKDTEVDNSRKFDHLNCIGNVTNILNTEINTSHSSEDIKSVNKSIFQEHERSKSPILIPTVTSVLNFHLASNIKRKVFSLESFEEVEKSANKKFKIQEYTFDDAEYSKTDYEYVLNDEIEGNSDIDINQENDRYSLNQINMNTTEIVSADKTKISTRHDIITSASNNENNVSEITLLNILSKDDFMDMTSQNEVSNEYFERKNNSNSLLNKSNEENCFDNSIVITNVSCLKAHNDTPIEQLQNDLDNVMLISSRQIKKEKFESKSICNNKCQGFTTASNKAIHISEEALAKTKCFFQDIEKIEFSNNPEFELKKPKLNKHSCYKTTNNDTIMQREAIDGTEKVFSLADINCKESNAFCGFVTASKKHIEITKEALATAKSVFKDIENINMDSQYMEKKEERGKWQSFTSNVTLEQEDKQYSYNASTYTAKNTVEFDTASSNDIAVSKDTFEKTKYLLKEYCGDQSDKQSHENIPYGFMTASKKKIAISKEALTKSKKIFQDFEKNNEGDKECISMNHISGFSTANKKKVLVSGNTVEKNKLIFNDFEIDMHINKKLESESKFKGLVTPDNNEKLTLEENIHTFEDIEMTQLETSKMSNVLSSINFQGFTTASNKNIKVSKDAVEKSKQIFKDLEGFGDELNKLKLNNIKSPSKNNIKAVSVENIEMSSNQCNTLKFNGFTTGNNSKIGVSQTALDSTKFFFSNVNNIKIEKKNYHQNQNKTDDIILDTQMQKNFEENLISDDFCKTPPKHQVRNKKSGSPILPNCTSKKRKKNIFKVPYRLDSKMSQIDQDGTKPEKKLVAEKKHFLVHKFDEEYKLRTQRIKLKDLKYRKNISINNPRNFDWDAIYEYKFTKNDLCNENVSIDDIKNIFLNSVDATIIPDKWIENHLKLILWKLISYEMVSSDVDGVATPKNVLEQLKYRYDRELNKVERPILRKILEKDETACRCMILCVVRIINHNGESDSVASAKMPELEITDGWYIIRATIDRLLEKAIVSGKIKSGTKLITQGAELVNCEEGIAPWEDTSVVRLKLSGNSTRRISPLSKLGVSRKSLRTALSTVSPEGGVVSRMRLYVARVYPVLYIERMPDGGTVTRSERLETIKASAHESYVQDQLEKLYSDMEREMASATQDGVDDVTRTNSDPMTETQYDAAKRYGCKKREEMLEKIQKRIQEKIEKSGLDKTARNVVPLLKIRVCSWQPRNNNTNTMEMTRACLSVWKPGENLLEDLKEGCWVDAMAVVPTAVRMSELNLSAGRQSVFAKIPDEAMQKLSPYTNMVMRECIELKDDHKMRNAPFQEVDFVGLVFLIDVSNGTNNVHNFQNVYLTDNDKNFVCLHFWGGINKFGYEKVIEVGNFISCVNLQVRMGNSKKSIPQFRVTELTTFTKVPRIVKYQNALEKLKSKFNDIDIDIFINNCVNVKNKSCLLANEPSFKINQSEYNLTKNKIFIDSPQMKTRQDDLNLTGLDFESSFQGESQKEDARKCKLRSKMEKLKLYGEPPPLLQIHIINKSPRVVDSFKSPFGIVKSLSSKCNIDGSNCKESVKRSLGIVTSPLSKCDDDSNNCKESIKRSFGIVKSPSRKCFDDDNNCKKSVNSQPSNSNGDVKHIHPLNLNFNEKANSSKMREDCDEFSEEFNYSPPLSLD